MGKLDDYRQGMINSLDPERLKEDPNSPRSKEYWAKVFAEAESRPQTEKEKKNLRIAATVHITMAIVGSAIWIAVIVFLFKSCSGS